MDALRASILGKPSNLFEKVIARYTVAGAKPAPRLSRRAAPRSAPRAAAPANSLERRMRANVERREKAFSSNMRRLANTKAPRRKRKLKPCKSGYARNPVTRRCKKERPSSLLFTRGRRKPMRKPMRKPNQPFYALKYKNRGIFAVSKESGAVYKCMEKQKRKCRVAGGKKWWIGNPRKATGAKQAALQRRLPGAVIKRARA